MAHGIAIFSTYSRTLALRIFLSATRVFLAAVAIFLAERSVSLISIVLDLPVGISDFFRLLAWTAPEIYLALPIAILVGNYQAILGARERLELVAVANGGGGPPSLLAATSLAALAFLAINLAISGYLFPYAKFAFRADRDQLRVAALLQGGTADKVMNFPNYTVYAFPGDGGDRPIFAKQEDGPSSFRIFNARRAELLPLTSLDDVGLRMFGTTVTAFDNVGAAVTAAPDAMLDCDMAIGRLRTEDLTNNFDIRGLIHTPSRGLSSQEWTTPQLLGWTTQPQGQPPPEALKRELGTRLARAFLSFLAPFLAWLAVSFTTRRTLLVVLPLGCVVLMGADVLSARLVGVLDPRGVVTLIVAEALAALMTLLLIARWIGVREQKITFPMFGRT